MQFWWVYFCLLSWKKNRPEIYYISATLYITKSFERCFIKIKIVMFHTFILKNERNSNKNNNFRIPMSFGKWFDWDIPKPNRSVILIWKWFEFIINDRYSADYWYEFYWSILRTLRVFACRTYVHVIRGIHFKQMKPIICAKILFGYLIWKSNKR